MRNTRPDEEPASPAHLEEIIQIVKAHISKFVKFPERALLLWEGCTRATKYHTYPDEIKTLRKSEKPKIRLNSLSNGPAIGAYLWAGGERPLRPHSKHGWTIHHLYFGGFGKAVSQDINHAVKDKLHFTQSAGLVAVHPIADALCHEVPEFTLYLREEAYRRFGYDPEKCFGKKHDKYGFVEGNHLLSDRILFK